MPDGGVITGYPVGDPIRHYRYELKSGKPSAAALCGYNPKDHNTTWIDNTADQHAEKRMDYGICGACQDALAS